MPAGNFGIRYRASWKCLGEYGAVTPYGGSQLVRTDPGRLTGRSGRSHMATGLRSQSVSCHPLTDHLPNSWDVRVVTDTCSYMAACIPEWGENAVFVFSLVQKIPCMFILSRCGRDGIPNRYANGVLVGQIAQRIILGFH